MTTSPAAGLRLSGLTKRFGARTAVEALTAEIAAGSLTALLGPSGCGKSTTLAMIAGLITPDSGEIYLDDLAVTRIRAEHRPVGVVLQKPLLFPHLTVEQNVGFGLRMRRTDRRETRLRVAEMLHRVQLPEFGARRPGELSGGQEQRVALARALILEPRVLLLDEPFSQLDAGLRAQMRDLVRQLHDEIGFTTLFVTHDQAEAVELADTIALMLDGRLVGLTEPATYYRDPPSLAAARFFGVTNEIVGAVNDGVFSDPDTTLRLPAAASNGPTVLTIRPETIRIASSDPTLETQAPTPDTRIPAPETRMSATVTGVHFAGTHLRVDLRLAGGQKLTAHLGAEADPKVGQVVQVGLPASTCRYFPL